MYHMVRKEAVQLTKSHSGMIVSWQKPASKIKLKVPRGMAHARDEMIKAVLSLRAEAVDKLATPLHKRLSDKLVNIYEAEIQKRGGEVEIVEQNRVAGLRVISSYKGLHIIGCDGFRYYSSKFGSRPASLRYLCGRDDNGRWAARVPGTINSVFGAIDWLEPKPLQQARAAGRTVKRQGDVYLVGGGRRDEGISDLPPTHRWDYNTRTLHHTGSPAHGPVEWGDEPVRVILQRRFTSASASRGFARD